MTADSIQKHKTAHLWHLVCWKWFWSFIRTLVMTKLSGFILVDKLSTVFQFIFCTRNRSIYSSVFLEDLLIAFTHPHMLFTQEWNLFFLSDGTSSISFSTLIFFFWRLGNLKSDKLYLHVPNNKLKLR